MKYFGELGGGGGGKHFLKVHREGSKNVLGYSICVSITGFPLHVFSRLFPGKINEIPGQFGSESVFVLIYVDMAKM